MSWIRTHKHRRSLAFTTTNSMMFASSPTSAPPSLTTSHWTQISTRGLWRQLQLSLVARLECGQAQSCLWRQIWRSTLPALSAHCCMAARHGLHNAGQESRFNTYHLRSIRRILGISWLDKVTNADVLSRAGLPSMHTRLRQRRLRWLGHVRRMDDGRIPKYILYGELALGRRTTGHPHLRYKDVCVRDMKAVDIDTMSWEDLAADRTTCWSALKQHLKTGKDKLMTDAADKRART